MVTLQFIPLIGDKLPLFLSKAKLSACVTCCSVAQLYLTLCNSRDCSTPGFLGLHYLPGFVQTHVHWVSDAIQPSHPLLLSSPHALNPSQHQSCPVSRIFASGGQSFGASASASILPLNVQDWFPLGLTGLISLLSRGLSRVSSSTTVWKHQCFGVQLSLCALDSIL